ncbi:MAG: hypothetical protein ABL983_10235, partial [Nitrospira sp.]
MIARFHAISQESAGCSERPSSEAATSEEAKRTLRYVEPLSDVRTKREDFLNSLLGGAAELAHLFNG